MTYSIKEIFYTLQGEGANAGRPAVFCRFSGCNLWSGREIHRERAVCQFCDTDFVGTDGVNGGKFGGASAVAKVIDDVWQGTKENKFVVFTGGEPLLQLDEEITNCVREHGFEIAVETNGTLPVPRGVDWVCVSPKFGAPLTTTTGQELKLVFPQSGLSPEEFEAMGFDEFYLQPMDGPYRQQNQELAVQYCLKNPKWRLSVQQHKYLGIP